jgi:hypothetical protein
MVMQASTYFYAYMYVCKICMYTLPPSSSLSLSLSRKHIHSSDRTNSTPKRVTCSLIQTKPPAIRAANNSTTQNPKIDISLQNGKKIRHLRTGTSLFHAIYLGPVHTRVHITAVTHGGLKARHLRTRTCLTNAILRTDTLVHITAVSHSLGRASPLGVPFWVQPSPPLCCGLPWDPFYFEHATVGHLKSCVCGCLCVYWVCYTYVCLTYRLGVTSRGCSSQSYSCTYVCMYERIYEAIPTDAVELLEHDLA